MTIRTAATLDEASKLVAAISEEFAEITALQAEARATRIGRALRDPGAYYARMVRLGVLDAELQCLLDMWGLDEGAAP